MIPLHDKMCHSSFLPRASWASSLSASSSEDEITPIAPVAVEAKKPVARERINRIQSRSSVASVAPISNSHSTTTCNTATSSDTALLWHRMLAIQRQYHCYKSARISAALENEFVEAIVPPRACLDLLNDSVSAQALPEDARREIAALVSDYNNDPVEVESCQTNMKKMQGRTLSNTRHRRQVILRRRLS